MSFSIKKNATPMTLEETNLSCLIVLALTINDYKILFLYVSIIINSYPAISATRLITKHLLNYLTVVIQEINLSTNIGKVLSLSISSLQRRSNRISRKRRKRRKGRIRRKRRRRSKKSSRPLMIRVLAIRQQVVLVTNRRKKIVKVITISKRT